MWLAVVVVAIPLFLVQETTLTIEYVPAIAPPDPQEPRVHDDWVSAVDGSFPRSVNMVSCKFCNIKLLLTLFHVVIDQCKAAASTVCAWSF